MDSPGLGLLQGPHRDRPSPDLSHHLLFHVSPPSLAPVLHWQPTHLPLPPFSLHFCNTACLRALASECEVRAYVRTCVCTFACAGAALGPGQRLHPSPHQWALVQTPAPQGACVLLMVSIFSLATTVFSRLFRFLKCLRVYCRSCRWSAAGFRRSSWQCTGRYARYQYFVFGKLSNLKSERLNITIDMPLFVVRNGQRLSCASQNTAVIARSLYPVAKNSISPLIFGIFRSHIATTKHCARRSSNRA